MQEEKTASPGPSRVSERFLKPVIAIHLAGFFFVAAALTLNPLKIARSFFSDEAVYYTMAYSFAFDADMEFERRDLMRVHHEFDGGPLGIILKVNERDRNLVFGKSFLYAAFVSPLVRFFGTNGFLLFHAILLWLNLLCGYKFCSAVMQPKTATAVTLFYFLANASLIYIFWMMPEYFNMSLVCYGIFFFVAAEHLQSHKLPFRAPYNYLFAALLFGMATYSKPTNLLLVVPLGIWMFYRKKVITALLAFALLVFVTIGLFGLNLYFTGDWNYQAGKRALFYHSYPFERPNVYEMEPFEKQELPKAMVAPPFYWNAFLSNWCYFFFGRYSGLAVYFFPMFFLLFFFLFAKKNSLTTAVYISGWIGILTYMVGIPWNYFGGSGTLGNRYLLSVFPVFLFAVNRGPSRTALTAGTLASLLFTSVFLFTPSFSSFRNAYHQEHSALFRVLPVEKTLIGDLPITAANRARRITFDNPPAYFIYFLDDRTYFREAHEEMLGFWVQGGKSAEVILRTFEKTTLLRIRMKSLSPNNTATIEINGTTRKYELTQPGFHVHDIHLNQPFAYDRDNTGATFLYTIRIESATGQMIRQDGQERYPGVFIRLELPRVGLSNKVPE